MRLRILLRSGRRYPAAGGAVCRLDACRRCRAVNACRRSAPVRMRRGHDRQPHAHLPCAYSHAAGARGDRKGRPGAGICHTGGRNAGRLRVGCDASIRKRPAHRCAQAVIYLSPPPGQASASSASCDSNSTSLAPASDTTHRAASDGHSTSSASPSGLW